MAHENMRTKRTRRTADEKDSADEKDGEQELTGDRQRRDQLTLATGGHMTIMFNSAKALFSVLR